MLSARYLRFKKLQVWLNCWVTTKFKCYTIYTCHFNFFTGNLREVAHSSKSPLLAHASLRDFKSVKKWEMVIECPVDFDVNKIKLLCAR